jgi:hypothetical protein
MHMNQRPILLGLFLLAASLACSPATSPSPSTPSELPSSAQSALARAIADTQSEAPPLPEGFTLETESIVGVSIARPAGWARDAGTKELPVSGAPVNYVVYYNASPGAIEMMNIQTLGFYYRYESESDLIRDTLGANEDKVASTNLRVIDFASSTTVASRPAQAMSYRIDDERYGLPLFSVIVIIGTSDNRAIILQWAANEDMRAETTELFLTMLPTVSLIP